MKNFTRLVPFLRIGSFLAVIGIAWAFRWHAVNKLPVDYDEDDYLRAAQQYATLIRSGNWGGFLNTNYRPEHPPLEKIVYGVSILSTPEEPLIPDLPTSAPPNTSLPGDLLHPARTVSAVLGTVEVAVLALVNPLAALLLGIHAFTIKYTSQVMLESLPALTSLLAVVCYTRWKRKRTRNIDGWLVTSALFLGLTAASKYLYCVAGIAILVDWILEAIQAKQLGKSILPVLCWGLVGILIFLIFDPYLWPNPIARLQESIFNNVSYSSNSIEVQKAGYPFWQPLVWLTMSPYIWHPQAFYFAIDPLISALAVFGLPGIWKKQRVFLLWFATSLLFLLLWPTKWPQYIITLTAPLALLAAEGIMTLFVRPISHWVAKRGTK